MVFAGHSARWLTFVRDSRWGRIAEGSGEDPYLGSLLAKAYVRGYQGNNMQGKNEILSCVKHFALYGASESGKDYNVVDMSRQRMYNEYLAPYKAAVEAGVGSVMSSFNSSSERVSVYSVLSSASLR